MTSTAFEERGASRGCRAMVMFTLVGYPYKNPVKIQDDSVCYSNNLHGRRRLSGQSGLGRTRMHHIKFRLNSLLLQKQSNLLFQIN